MAAKTDPSSTLSLPTGRKLATADTLNRYSTHDDIKINYFLVHFQPADTWLLLVFSSIMLQFILTIISPSSREAPS